MTTNPSKQISFRIADDLAAKLDKAAEYEDLSVADFVRKVFRVGFERYEKLGSLHALRVESDEQKSKHEARRR